MQTCDTQPSYSPTAWYRMYQGCLDTLLTPRMPEVLGWENSFFSKMFTQTRHHLCGFFPNPSLSPSLALFSGMGKSPLVPLRDSQQNWGAPFSLGAWSPACRVHWEFQANKKQIHPRLPHHAGMGAALWDPLGFLCSKSALEGHEPGLSDT